MSIQTLRFFFLNIIFCFFCTTCFSQQPALLIQRFFPNPNGTPDAPDEFVELVATRSINFSTEPFTVVFADGSIATSAGWITGGTGTYAFQISTGTAAAGDIVYVGGSGLSSHINGGGSCKILRQLNTSTTNGDGFGTKSDAALGNGGSNADGLAVFNMAATAITSSTIPVDAVFYGSAIGSAASKFTTPDNDLYNGGIFGTSGNTFLAPDPGGDDFVYVTSGAFNNSSFTWTTSRSWGINTTKPNCTDPSKITLGGGSSTGTLTLSFNIAATSVYLNPPYVSGVINDPTDPAKINGILVDVKENGVAIPLADYTLTANSSNTAVVSNANLNITKGDGMATVKITPSGVGYSNITLTLTKGGNNKTLTINFAASANSSTPAATRWHTGISDASDAIALDNDYYLTGDDELNIINVYSRGESGLPVKSYNYASGLGLPDGVAEEVDVEAVTRSPNIANRIYWLGSMSNGKEPNFNSKPNRNRLFATAVSGTGNSTSISVEGYYGNLRARLIAWGDANGYNFTSSAAAGKDSKTTSGFAAEGMVFAPDNTTLYIGLRAPLVPTTNRTKAVIAPISNFESWFNNGSPSGNPTISSPIELDLGGRGIRDLVKLSNGAYIIVAGNPASNPITNALYMWSGIASDAPVLLSAPAANNLNVEGLMEISEMGTLSGTKFQVISDEGTEIFYNDGTEAKDLSQNNYKKFRSDIITYSGSWKYIFNGNGNWDNPNNWINKIVPPAILPENQEIILNPITTGECLLNIKQRISTGATLTISPGINFRIPENLIIQ